MADLLERLQTIAVGGPARLAPRPRSRFEPDSGGRDRPAWIDEEHEELDAEPPRPRPAPPAGDHPRPRATNRLVPARRDASSAPPVATAATPPSATPPASGVNAAAPPTDMAPAPTRIAVLPTTEPARPLPASSIAPEAHIIHEVDRVHEVARVERHEASSAVVELVRWIEAPPAPSDHATAHRAAPAGDRDGPGAAPSGRPAAESPARPHGVVATSPVEPLAEVSAPRVNVSIARLEVRTAPDPRPQAAGSPPAGEPELRFAGPSLDEFLEGTR